jgi:hypothetical protein
MVYPDGVPGFAIPFYLAHPRLMRLERKYMREVEGGTDVECMRILRHEAGHAIDNAFRLHFKRQWIRTFGSFTQKYPPSYKPKPNSRRYVLNLDAWYAQAHPAEDFAETFAVWLQPRSNWRRRYRGWPALRKLEYIDELLKRLPARVREIACGEKSKRSRRSGSRCANTTTASARNTRLNGPLIWTTISGESFPPSRAIARAKRRQVFCERVGPEIQQLVSEGTGVHGYAIDHVLELMVERAAQLKLRVVGREELVKRHLMIMLTVQTMNVVHSGYYRIAL